MKHFKSIKDFSGDARDYSLRDEKGREIRNVELEWPVAPRIKVSKVISTEKFFELIEKMKNGDEL